MKKRKLKFNKTMISLIGREIKSVLFSTTGFVVGILFTIVVGILVFGIAKFTQFGTNDLTQIFSYMVFAMAIAIPALVMGSISKERNNGTIEYILAKPISEIELLFSKFVSYSFLSTLLILLTLPLTVITGIYAGLDVGQVVMQYVGAIVLAVSIVSVGIAISALFKTEVASFLTTAVVVAVFIIAGSSFFNFLPAGVSVLLDRISLLSHYQSISRGVLDFRDLFYFVAFIFLFLSLAYYLLIKDKYPRNHKYLRNTKITTLLFVIIAFLVGTLGQVIPGRIDFTSDQRYTLSESTVSVISKFQDQLTIDYYASSNLPIEFQTELRRVSDMLTDYTKASNGKIIVNNREPDRDESVKTEAEAAGIEQIRFSVNSDDSSQVVVGYFGITLSYQDQTDLINFNNQVLNDLEYQLTKKIKKMTETDKKVIGFVSNNVLNTTSTNLTVLGSELADLFEVQQLSLTKDTPLVPSEIDLVVITGPSDQFDPEVIESIKNFYINGGSVMLLTDTVDTNQETPVLNPAGLGDLFADFGVSINNNIVYDLENNNVVAIQSLFSPVVFNFPQWIITQPLETPTGINQDVSSVSLLWASTINIADVEGQTVYPLLATGFNSNVQTEGNFSTSFEQTWGQKDNDNQQIVGVAMENTSGGRAVVIGDADFITDNILEALSQRQSQDKEVISFTLNSISWLSRDSLVGSIKAKTSSAKLLNLSNSQQVTYVVVSSVVPTVICGVLFLGFSINRRRLTKKTYSVGDKN